MREDLLSERQRLQHVYEGEAQHMSRASRRENRLQVQAIDSMLRSPKAMEHAPAVFAAAQQYIEHANEVERGLVRQRVLEPEQALAAKVRPYAVAHMGARFDKTLRSAPAAHAAYQEAKAVEGRALARLRTAQRNLEHETARRNRTVGRNASQRGRDAAQAGRGLLDERAVLRREAERGGAMAQALRAVKAARVEVKKAKKELSDARGARVAAHPKRTATGLVDAEGRRISTDEIVAHMKANGVALPGFVSHRHDVTGARSYFVNFMQRRQTVDAHRRTGEATRTGGHASDMSALAGSLVHGQGVLDAVESFDRFAREFGMRRPDGQPFTFDEAVRFNEARASLRNGPTGEVEMVPVRVVPARFSPERQAEILSAQSSGHAPDLEGLIEQKFSEALRPPEGADRTARNVVLVPAPALERFRQHQLAGSSPLGKAAQKATGLFRGAVLPFSTKWLTGNVVEATLRSALAGITPLDIVKGRAIVRMVEHADEEAARELRARVTPGLLYGSADRLSVHRDRTALEGTGAEPLAVAAGAAVRLPVIRQTFRAIEEYQSLVFALNRGMERAFQHGVIGKRARQEIQELTGSWVKAMRFEKAAMEDVARGLTASQNQVAFARQVDAILGKYTRFSPTTRRVIQAAAPFLPWYLNSLRFVLHTLPAGHPVATALIAHGELVFRQEHADELKDVPPGDLQAAIPLKDGGLLNLSRFTPFGAFTNLPAGLLDPLLPQISDVGQILDGRSWTGADLKLSNGDKHPSGGVRAALALYALLESVLPGVQLARRLQEHGETSFDDSTAFAPKTKPDTSYGSSAVDRVLNPVRPTYLHPPTAEENLTPQQRRELERAFGRARVAQHAAKPGDEELSRLFRRARVAAQHPAPGR
jgi:hypothetical protein